MTTIKERILQIADNQGLKREEFFNNLGLSYANFKGIQKKSALSSDSLVSILSKYPDVNSEWLLTGNGPMIKPLHEPIQVHDVDHKSTNAYKKTISGQTKSEYLLRTDIRRQEQLVPLFNLEAAAGLVQLFQNDQTTPIDYISIPNLPKCDGAIYVVGDSMYPLLKSGDIVMYKQVQDITNSIFWGEMYILHIDIDGDAFTTVKYVHKSDVGPDYIKLVSQNQHHSPKDINIRHVKAAALVKASIRINSMM